MVDVLTARASAWRNLPRWTGVAMAPVLVAAALLVRPGLGLAAPASDQFLPRSGLPIGGPTANVHWAPFWLVGVTISGLIAGLYDSRRQVGLGREGLAATLGSIGDAVIVTDLEGRVTFLNRAAEGLTGWTSQEAVGQPVSSVFRIVNEESGETVEEPGPSALRLGTVVRLTDHTLLIAKDGREILIEGSGAPVREGDAEAHGVVLLFRDTTEQSRADARTRHLASFPRLNPNPILEVSGTGTVTFANPAAQAILEELGLSAGDASVFLPADFESVVRELGTRPAPSRYREVAIKHRVFGESISRTPESDVTRIYAFDITERKKIEDALRQSEEQLRLVIERTKDYAFFMLDPGGCVVSWNAGAERIKGYRAEEILGQYLSCFYTPEDVARGRPEQALHQAATVGWAEKEGWRVRKDGSLFWASVVITALRDDDGTLRGFSKVTRDITQRRQAEEIVRESQARLAAIIETAMDAIVTVDEDQRIVLFNAAAEQTFGCPASEAIGTPLDRFMPERFRESHRRHITTFGATGVTARSMSSPATLHGRRASGEEFPFEATISQASTGGHKLYTVILRDITRRREAEELARLYAKTKELDELRTAFFANISHELRTPLALILGVVGKRLGAGGLGDDERRDLHMVERNARSLLRHVNDLLDLARLDARRMDAEYAEVDLARLTRVTASNFGTVATDRGLGFVVDVPDALPAQVDPPKIERVMLNLLANAFKFTPAGGRVRLTLRQHGDRAILEVEDTGPGIPRHLRQTIFERFHQVEGGSNRRFGGTGLGLSIVKELVSLHGGSVTVDDTPGGVGSVFRVELPLRAPSDREVRGVADRPDVDALRQAAEDLGLRHEAPPDVDQPLGTATALVLLVEDNADMNAFLAQTLSARYRVVSAFDGQSGLEKALELHPDLILCDVMMPRLSGDQLVQELRRRPELDDVAIVLLTAKADDALRVTLLREGAQDYLHKPVDVAVMLAKVERLLADRQRAAEALRRSREISTRLIVRQDRERQRIAEDLHENIAQCLAALRMNFSLAQTAGADPGPDVERVLAEGPALLERCSADIRTLSYALHSPILDHLGLAAAFEWHVADFTRRSGIQVSLDIPPTLPRLSAELELALFRIMEEALTNVRRHSGSATATVRLTHEASEITLDVIDQGRGMPPAEGNAVGPVTKGTGLVAIRERVRALGGRLEIASQPGGTCVRAVLPSP